jgi:hypothetical protein
MLVACAHLSLVATLEEQQPLSLARTHKIDRQRKPKTHNRQTSEVAEKRKLKIFLLQMCSRIIIEQRQEEQASEQGGGGGVLVGRSVGLMFS